jgi:hypothetical protein
MAIFYFTGFFYWFDIPFSYDNDRIFPGRCTVLPFPNSSCVPLYVPVFYQNSIQFIPELKQKGLYDETKKIFKKYQPQI